MATAETAAVTETQEWPPTETQRRRWNKTQWQTTEEPPKRHNNHWNALTTDSDNIASTATAAQQIKWTLNQRTVMHAVT